jgi:hypothetical protein
MCLEPGLEADVLVIGCVGENAEAARPQIVFGLASTVSARFQFADR